MTSSIYTPVQTLLSANFCATRWACCCVPCASSPASDMQRVIKALTPGRRPKTRSQTEGHRGGAPVPSLASASASADTPLLDTAAATTGAGPVAPPSPSPRNAVGRRDLGRLADCREFFERLVKFEAPVSDSSPPPAPLPNVSPPCVCHCVSMRGWWWWVRVWGVSSSVQGFTDRGRGGVHVPACTRMPACPHRAVGKSWCLLADLSTPHLTSPHLASSRLVPVR